MTENELSKIVFESGLKIHRKLGAGWIIWTCLWKIENAFRLDMIIKNKLILEIKTVDYINPTHKSQLLAF